MFDVLIRKFSLLRRELAHVTLKEVLGMASAIFDIITMDISKVVEAVFDLIEYRLAQRALRQAGKPERRRAASGKSLIAGMRMS